MPMYDFRCKKCEHEWDVLTPYDETKEYKSVKCPECGSNKKEQLIKGCFAIGGPTSSKMDNFGYRAGYNMEKAQGERRAAEEAAGGDSPYSFGAESDFAMGEGLHDPETRPGMS